MMNKETKKYYEIFDANYSKRKEVSNDMYKYFMSRISTECVLTGLTGGNIDKLDGCYVTELEEGKIFVVMINNKIQLWQLRPGTDAEDEDRGIVRPDQYFVGKFEFVFKRIKN